MDKYLSLIVNRFETYISFLNQFEPTNEAAIFINNSFIYSEMERVNTLLNHNKNLTHERRRDYEFYFIELFHVYHNTNDSKNKFDAMIYSLKNAIQVLKLTEHPLVKAEMN